MSNNTSVELIAGCYKVFNTNYGILEEWDRFVLLICLVIAFVFINTSSIMLIYALLKTNTVCRMTTKIFIYLSSCDLLTGLFTVPLQIVSITMGSNVPCVIVGMQAFFNAFGPIASMCAIFTLTVMRYLAIKKPLKKIDNQTIFFALFLQIVLSLLLSTIYTYLSLSPYITVAMGIYLLVTALFVFVFITIVVILNIIVHLALKVKKDDSSRVRTESVIRNVHQREATNMLLILSILLLVCYFPNAVSFSVIGYNIIINNSQKNSFYREYTPWTHYLVLLNSGFNSFAYIQRN